MLSAISFIGAFAFSGCSCCRFEADMVEEKSFVDGYFKYYYIKETNSYAIVGYGEVPYPETLAIPAYYNGKEVSDMYYIVTSGIYFDGALGPSFKNVSKVYFSFSSEIDYSMEKFYRYNNIPCEKVLSECYFLCES